MHKLEPPELRCLSAIANGLHGESGICSKAVLAQLLARGLIVSRTRLFLPLEWVHPDYSLTDAGKEALHVNGG